MLPIGNITQKALYVRKILLQNGASQKTIKHFIEEVENSVGYDEALKIMNSYLQKGGNKK